MPSPISATSPSMTNTPDTVGCSPNRIASSRRRSAKRLTGVNRKRSITPARSSAMSPNPTPLAPKSPSWISSPGTNTLYAPPVGNPGVRVSDLSRGAKSTRYSTGWSTPIATQAGLRRKTNRYRWNISQVSLSNFMAILLGRVAQRTPGLTQEHVVQAWTIQRERGKHDALGVERADDLWHGGLSPVDIEAPPAVAGCRPANERPAAQQWEHAVSRVAGADPPRVAAPLPLQRE